MNKLQRSIQAAAFVFAAFLTSALAVAAPQLEEITPSNDTIAPGEYVHLYALQRGQPLRWEYYLKRVPRNPQPGTGRTRFLFPIAISDLASINAPFKQSSLLTSLAGTRIDPVGKKESRRHDGWDIAGREGEPTFAPADGVVTRMERNAGNCGTMLVMEFGGANGLYGKFCHMSAFAGNLKVNSRVRRGDTVGYVGHTGHVTGPHAHLEIHQKKNLTKACKVPGSTDTLNPACAEWDFMYSPNASRNAKRPNTTYARQR